VVLLQAGGIGGVTEELTIFKKGNEHLPEGWEWSSLGKVSNVIAGNPAPQGEQFFENGTYPFVRIQDMGRELVVAVTNGSLDFGPWEQIFYGE
jgi:hypothetical protein